MAENRDFNIQVNVNGLGPVDVMMEDPSPGPHMMEILDVKLVTAEREGDKTTLRFTLMDVEEGSLTKGICTSCVLGTDWSKEFNVRHVVNLLMGMGAKADRLKGVVALSPSFLRGKRAPIYVKAPPDELDELGKRRFANKNFITLDMYEAAKRSGAAMRARMPAANQPMRSTPANPPISMAANSSMTPPAGVVSSTVTSAIAQPPNNISAANGPAVVELGDLFA